VEELVQNREARREVRSDLREVRDRRLQRLDGRRCLVRERPQLVLDDRRGRLRELLRGNLARSKGTRTRAQLAQRWRELGGHLLRGFERGVGRLQRAGQQLQRPPEVRVLVGKRLEDRVL